MNSAKNYRFRFYFVIVLLGCGFLALIVRLLDLSIFDRSFLQQQGNARILRMIDIPSSRGMILDRNNVPIAISTPVDSVWINPQMFEVSPAQLNSLARLLDLRVQDLQAKISHKKKYWFIYLKRHLSPSVATQIKNLEIPGLFFQREYQRYYPEGEVMAHVLGFTNLDDRGQEGLELGYDSWLHGTPGKMRVVKDRLGHVVSVIGITTQPQDGHNLVLSIDRRIQYLAYYELKKAIAEFNAESGSVVVLDIKTGEVLAMVNNPSFNPNVRNVKTNDARNRAVTDTFEPGSTIKTFSVASALASGKYFPTTRIDTNPGWYKVAGNTITDDKVNHGVLTVTGVLQKSSNIGIAKIILSLPQQNLINMFKAVGFGELTYCGYPGEASGEIVDMRLSRPFVLATLSFGYGLSVTPLQLTRAYAVIGALGIKRPVTFLRQDHEAEGRRVVAKDVAKQMLTMLQTVLQEGGTAMRAQVPGYQVAGKTGTARIAEGHGYSKDRHMSSFVGIAPVSDPRLVVAVIIRNPKGQDFGGLVAAPAFSTIMGGALRTMGVTPDDVTAPKT